MKFWMRQLEVRLTSKKLKKTLVFGKRTSPTDEPLYINVEIYKYLSALKDQATIEISNLTYNEILMIIDGGFYDVEIAAGYKDSGLMTLFKGGVLYISNEIEDAKTNVIVILCASTMIARYGQSQINLTINSGINLYSALKFLARRIGMKDTSVSPYLKQKFLQNAVSNNKSIAGFLDELCKHDNSLIINSDDNEGAKFTLYDAAKSNGRVIKIKESNIIMRSYPQLNEDGLHLSVLPMINFKCGDVIQLDNALIQMPVRSRQEMMKNYGHFLDTSGDFISKDGSTVNLDKSFGNYMIFEIKYILQNRDAEFKASLLCKSKTLVSKLIME